MSNNVTGKEAESSGKESQQREAGAGKHFSFFLFFLFRSSDLEIWHPSAAEDPRKHLFHFAILQRAPSMACVPPGSVGWLREFPWLQGKAMAGSQLAPDCLQVSGFPKYSWNWSLHGLMLSITTSQLQ